jgi:predicted  nucleic acid-binding Zn-ribbon protein
LHAVERLSVDIDERVLPLLRTLNRKVDRMSEQQAELDQDVQALGGMVSDVATQTSQLGTDLSAIEQWIADQPTDTPVDLSGLTSLVQTAQQTQQGLDSQVQAVTDAVPSAPAPDQPPSGN